MTGNFRKQGLGRGFQNSHGEEPRLPRQTSLSLSAVCDTEPCDLGQVAGPLQLPFPCV